MELIHGAPSWKLTSSKVTLHVTEEAGMMAPAHFDLGSLTASPYSLSPWQPDAIASDLPPLLKVLRGDFFCLPFGPQDDGQPHGESANASWQLSAQNANSLTISLQDQATNSTLTRKFSLIEGHTAIYYENSIEGLQGPWSYGTHPVLDCSSSPENSAHLSVSPFRWASVYPGQFSNPADQESQALKPGATFDQLDSVPLADGGHTDLSTYPARPGNDDLVMMVNAPATEAQPFAWSAVVFENYLWFALKNPADFPATLFWLSNAGRQAAPWNGQHAGRLGIEEVCSHFHDNVKISREDRLADQDIPTTRQFDGSRVNLPTIHAVAAIPANFGKVISIIPTGPKELTITGDSQQTIKTTINWKHLL